ncbi:transcription regulator (plasmid) [Haloarcula marismortui ATCC 43049]|uniref:Transcription regulator n=1 Tax=Haloarcula marismortui (strain ATCC 43049 / DSM 3752 / JCM 8966 / VKM B-1809) TaxID=272569 RepID=Q5V7Y1_HALMA|nr:transcriptional regulator [Haloarcula marismortui]AAV44339.1 transcription regulator [Haloarcula marismortui ATCC 43049]
MTDLDGVEDDPDWAAFANLSPVAQTCLLVVEAHDGDGWRGLIAQKAQEGLDTSDRWVREQLSELEAKGLVEASGPNKRRETYSVTEDGHEVLAGMRDSLDRALGEDS